MATIEEVKVMVWLLGDSVMGDGAMSFQMRTD